MPLFKRRVLDWEEHLLDKMHPESTVELYRNAGLRVYRWAAKGNAPLNPMQWSPKDFRRYWESVEHLAPGTQCLYLTTLKSFLVWAGNDQFRDVPIRIHPERFKVTWLTEAQTAMMLATADRPQLSAVLALGFMYGLRPGEIPKIRMGDITPDRLRVRGKGRKTRSLTLDKDFWTEIGEYWTWRQKQKGEFFVMHEKGPYTRGSVSDMVRTHARRLGLEASGHTMRRTFARHMYQHGCPLPELSRILGHASTEMTERYIGITQEDLQDAMKYRPKYHLLEK